MLKFYRNTIILLSLSFSIFAAEYDLSGGVFDKSSGEPLAYANLYFEGTEIGTATDEDGNFYLSHITFDTGVLKVSMMGYEPTSNPIQFPLSRPLKIYLEKTLIEMSSIVITGTRTERYLKDVPVTTQVLKGAKLRETASLDVSQILGEVTGVSLVENQFGTGVELAGFGTDHILVLVDGMEILGRTNGQLDISQISSDQIERIEVVKGASSALYGSEAMGGIINIITKKPQEDFTFSAGGNAGSYGRYNGNITLTGGIGPWRSKVYGNARQYGGNNLNNNSIWENGSKYNKYSTGLRLENPKVLGGILRFDNNLYYEKQKLNSENLFEDITDNIRIASRLEYEGNRKNIQYNTGIEYSYFNHLYEQFVTSSGYKKSSATTIENDFKTDITFQTELKNNLLNGGIGFEYESIESDRIDPNNQHSNLLFGFIQDEWKLNQKITLLSGMRIDAHSLYGNYFSPKFSLMYKPEPISRIRLSYGHGFKAPTFKEMFLDYIVTQLDPNLHIKGNPDLKPEISNSIIFDVERWHSKKYHARISVFLNEIQNLIDYVRTDMDELNRPIWRTANIYKAVTKGFDIDLTYFFTPKIEFIIGYSFLDTWDVDNKSPINLKAKHKANAKILIKLPFGIDYNLRTQFVGQRFFGEFGINENESTEEWIDKYMLVHTNINIPILYDIEINAGVNNLTDQFDVDWGPMPGREWYVGLTFNQK